MTGAATETSLETLVIERDMPHPPEKIWRALATSALIADWLMPNDFVAEPGHKFTFRTTPMPHWDGVVQGEVLTVEPPSRLAYRWDHTIVTWTLTPIPGGATVRMEQSGFRPGEENNLKGARFGWERMIGALERVTATLGD